MLESGILLVDHIQFPLPPHDLAIRATFFDGRSDFHRFNFYCPSTDAQFLFVPEYDPSPAKIVWTHFNTNLVTRQYPDVVHSHFSRDGGQYFVTVFELHFEHCVRKRFYDGSVLFNECLFRHTFWVRKDMGITWNNENRGPFFHFGVKKSLLKPENNRKSASMAVHSAQFHLGHIPVVVLQLMYEDRLGNMPPVFPVPHFKIIEPVGLQQQDPESPLHVLDRTNTI